jgi:hypothetical protein
VAFDRLSEDQTPRAAAEIRAAKAIDLDKRQRIHMQYCQFAFQLLNKVD